MATLEMRAEFAPVIVRVPFTASSVAVARKQLKRWMADQGSSRSRIEDARVIVSELLGNSVRHSRPLSDGTLLIAWSVEPRGFRLSVTDGGGTSRPHMLNASPSATAGRGMAIVDSLAISWWAEQTSSRTTVHAVLSFD